MLIAFHKPFGVLSQFTDDGSGRRTLQAFGFPKAVYPVGRLDADSEGLLLLTDEKGLNTQLLDPRHGHRRVYWAQVEGEPSEAALDPFRRGVVLQGRRALPCQAWRLATDPPVPPRIPPIRFRRAIPTSWLALQLVEGRNRQVRRMTAAIGHPTLRLIRVAIGGYELGALAPGNWRVLEASERGKVFA